MINTYKNTMKDTPEYESFGENEFPLKYLTENELLEFGFKKGCCSGRGCSKSKNGSCGGCSKKNNESYLGCSQNKVGCCKNK